MSESMKNHALNYAVNGWYVMPINSKNKTPLTLHGVNDATNDLAKILKWWGKWPNANIAIHTGKSRLAVLDVDPRNGGKESLAKLITIHGKEFLSNFEVITGGDGKHFYYALNESNYRSLPSHLGKGLDLLSGNKYVIAPPSIHVSGKAYKWITSPFNSEEVLDDEL